MITTKELIACVIIGSMMLLMIAMSIVLLCGKGGWLIAGFNMLDKKQQDRYDSAALCKFMGKYLLSVGLLLPTIPVGVIFQINWLPFVFTAYALISTIFVIVYCNTGDRFKK